MRRAARRHADTATSSVTAVETRDGSARFVISAGEPGEPGVREQPSASRRRSTAMVRQHVGRSRVPWEDALEEFLRRAEGTRLRWWPYGSGALAVRGLPVEPRDLDLNVDDAALAGHLLDDLVVAPVERLSGWVAVARIQESTTEIPPM